MKRSKKDYKDTWVTTVTSIIALVFVILVSTGVVTQDQANEAGGLVMDAVTAVSVVIASIAGLIGVFKGDR